MENNEVIKTKREISKNKVIIFLLIVIVLLVGLSYYLYNDNFKDGKISLTNSESIDKEKDIIINEESDIIIDEGNYKIVDDETDETIIEKFNLATYNGGNVDSLEYNIYYKAYSSILEMYGYSEEMVPEQIAYKVANDEILLKLANESNITLSDEDIIEIDEMMNDKDQIGELIERGLDESQIEDLYINDMLMANYISYLAKSLTEEEMLTYLKEQYGEEISTIGYNTSHILIINIDDEGDKLKGQALENALNKANDTLNRVKSGEDFATIAKEVSEDTGNKDDGGEYIVYLDGNTVEEYEEATKKLKVGEYTTELVETEYGYHIIKLNSIDEKARINDEYERQNLAYSNLGDLTEEYNLEYDYDALEVVHEKITGNVIKLTDSDEIDN